VDGGLGAGTVQAKAEPIDVDGSYLFSGVQAIQRHIGEFEFRL